MFQKLTVLLFAAAFLFPFAINAQRPGKSSKKDNTKAVTAKPAPPQPATGPRPYSEVITAKAKTDDGLFKIHKVEEVYALRHICFCFFRLRDAVYHLDLFSGISDRQLSGCIGILVDAIGMSHIQCIIQHEHTQGLF